MHPFYYVEYGIAQLGALQVGRIEAGQGEGARMPTMRGHWAWGFTAGAGMFTRGRLSKFAVRPRDDQAAG